MISESGYPQEDGFSIARRLGIGLASYLDAVYPGAGFAAQQLAEQFIPNPIETRRAAFINEVVKGVSDLERRIDGFNSSKLLENDEFITAIMETAPLAMKTHLESKRRRFANVALNVAAGRTIHDVLKGRFLSLVDQFSDEHIYVLQVLGNPNSFPALRQYRGNISGATFDVIKLQLDTVGISPDIQYIIYVDLQQERLAQGNAGSLGGGSSFSENNLTDMGKTFMEFIKAP